MKPVWIMDHYKYQSVLNNARVVLLNATQISEGKVMNSEAITFEGKNFALFSQNKKES